MRQRPRLMLMGKHFSNARSEVGRLLEDCSSSSVGRIDAERRNLSLYSGEASLGLYSRRILVRCWFLNFLHSVRYRRCNGYSPSLDFRGQELD
jgi:hypothetical protein